MDERFKIFTPQLREGNAQQIDFEADPAFMDVDEPVLKFPYPVSISGEVYIATDELILHLNASTKAILPCNVCNEPVTLDIESKGFYHTVPLEDVKNGVYNFSEAVRENLLVETPDYVECNDGKCASRESVKKYFKEPGSTNEDEGQRPFANL